MDIGRDNGGVVDLAYEDRAPYAFTGTVKKVVFDLKPAHHEAETELHAHAVAQAVGAGAAGIATSGFAPPEPTGSGGALLRRGGDTPEFARHFRAYAVEIPGEPGRGCHERVLWEGDGHMGHLAARPFGFGVVPVGPYAGCA